MGIEKNVTAGQRGVKGIKLSYLNVIMVSITVLIYSLALWKTVDIHTYYNQFIDSTQSYINSRNDALLLGVGSDYLTSEARLFAVTENTKHLNNYFYELETAHRRDTALERMKQHTDDKQLISQLEDALEHSNRLAQKEIYSMRLVSEAKHDDLGEYHQLVRQCTLSEEDKSLSDNDKKTKARKMLLDSDYQSEKALIDAKVSACTDRIIDIIREEQLANSENLDNTICLLTFFRSLMLILGIMIFAINIFYVIKPLNMFMQCIKAGKPLKQTGAYEFNYLAHTFNDIYELNEANKTLQYTAEHDSLTGLLNRGAFETISCLTAEKETPIALLFIDLDNFKNINDTYGHAVGDLILKKFSRELLAEFRATDCVARLGGDEFVVMLMNVSEETNTYIHTVINKLNDKMREALDNLPGVTISVGAAFSSTGYSDKLFKQADHALYAAKKSGKGKCVFYEEEQ